MSQIESMRVLVSVVDAGSLSAASRKLGMPLATVSRKISQLESHLKAPLLIRSTRQLKLTDAGSAYVGACRRILDDILEADRTATGEYGAPRGEVIVTAPFVFGRLHVMPVLCEFLHAYPEVNVRCALGDRPVNLLDEQIHAAVRIGVLPDSGLIATGLGAVRRVVCASPTYLARHGRPSHPRDLAAHQCVGFELFATADSWSFDIEGDEVRIPFRPRLVVNTAEAAIDAVIAGVGLTSVLSYQVESAVRSGQLEIVLQDFEPGALPVSVLYSDQGRLPLKLRALLDFAAPRLRVRLKKVSAALASTK